MLPVVLLAGGQATRMRPITDNIPKSLIDVNGFPFIYHQLGMLRKKGIDHVILCLGYLGEKIEEYVGNGNNFNLKVVCYYDGKKLLGTGGALKNILDKLPDTFFVLYGDSYLDIDYKNIEEAYFSSKKKALMTVFRNNNQWDTSNVIFIDRELVKYSKKNKSNKMNYIDYGLGVLKKSAFDFFDEMESFDLSDIYERLSDERELFGYEVFERFYEIGSYSGLSDLRLKLKIDGENEEGSLS